MAHVAFRSQFGRSWWSMLGQFVTEDFICTPWVQKSFFRAPSQLLRSTVSNPQYSRFAGLQHLAPVQPAGRPHPLDQSRLFAVRRGKRKEPPRKPEISALSNPVDWSIDSDEVLLVQGSSSSVMRLSAAIKMAQIQNLNLVQVSVQNSQPVCRLLDFAEMQRVHKEGQEKRIAEDSEKEKRMAKMKGVRLGWNIAKHDLDVKMRQVEEFLNKGKMVAVSTTYEYRGNKWQEQYPKAVQVAKTVWTTFKDRGHCWYDFSESGNKQVTIMFSDEPPPSRGRHTLLPWEAGSMLPPFLQAMQNEAQQRSADKK